ncbi:MAG: hypothetical protein A2138_02815 [Deltaproteobacteria bacterium RBG_16_71_12]|nr:MAG: hypothetical protein A2138_02815 [Deltaproteobacteria bacterium RBG_16_71_12]
MPGTSPGMRPLARAVARRARIGISTAARRCTRLSAAVACGSPSVCSASCAAVSSLAVAVPAFGMVVLTATIGAVVVPPASSTSIAIGRVPSPGVVVVVEVTPPVAAVSTTSPAFGIDPPPVVTTGALGSRPGRRGPTIRAASRRRRAP